MQETNNLHLKLPDLSDSFDIEHFNGNFKAIDDALSDRVTAVNGDITTDGKWTKRVWSSGMVDLFLATDRVINPYVQGSTDTTNWWRNAGTDWKSFYAFSLPAYPDNVTLCNIQATVFYNQEEDTTKMEHTAPITVGILDVNESNRKARVILTTANDQKTFNGKIMIHAVGHINIKEND